MHEIAKYFLLTEIQEQCLNPVPATRSGPSRLTEVYIYYILVQFGKCNSVIMYSNAYMLVNEYLPIN
eukprot:COSAG05_NODE_9303_length_633_cov_1.237828_2_plen_67_part_01